jgi:hypothetical protein
LAGVMLQEQVAHKIIGFCLKQFLVWEMSSESFYDSWINEFHIDALQILMHFSCYL